MDKLKNHKTEIEKLEKELAKQDKQLAKKDKQLKQAKRYEQHMLFFMNKLTTVFTMIANNHDREVIKDYITKLIKDFKL